MQRRRKFSRGLKSAFKGKKALITGGLGFMGSNLAHDLVSLGSDVTILDAMLRDYGANTANIAGIADRVQVIIDDLRTSQQLQQYVSRVDFVFHYAAQVSHGESFKNPYTDIDINCLGTLRLLEALRKSNPKARMIHAGTRGQYGRPLYLPIDEKHVEFPGTPYGASKFAAEKYCHVYSRVYGLKVTSLRFTNVYGPHHQMQHAGYGILNWFIRQAILKHPIEVWDGHQKRDFLYVDDATEAALMAAARNKFHWEVFVVSSGKSVTILQVVKLIARLAGDVVYHIVPYPNDQKPFEVGDVLLSNRKIRRALGWKAATELKEGLSKTISYYSKRMKDYFMLAVS